MTRRPVPALARVAVLAVLVGGTAAAQAQMHLAPGLWEESISFKSDNPQMNAAMAQMQERLAAMPPEQRKQVEQQMAARGMGIGSNGLRTLRICISKEQAARDFVPDRGGKCSRQDVVRSGNTINFAFTCSEGRGQVTGKGVATFNDPKSFAVSSDSDVNDQGRAMHIHSDVTGRFLSADCGDVKPFEAPPARK